MTGLNEVNQMLDRAADGAFMIDADQQIIYWNRAAREILGYTFNEVKGQPCYAVLCGCDDKGTVICRKHCAISVKAAKSQIPPTYDLAVRAKSGQLCWINVSILTFRPPGDDPPSIIHLFRDATQAKQNEHFVRQMFNAMKVGSPLTPPASVTEDSNLDVLTEREHHVLALLVEGYSTGEIAETLSISPSTVRNHIQNVLHKFRVHSRLEAVVYAVKHGLVRLR